MQKSESSQPRRRDSISAAERHRRLEATTECALAAIKGEAEARRLKTERLRAAREAALAQGSDPSSGRPDGDTQDGEILDEGGHGSAG